MAGDRTAFFGVELHDLGIRARQVVYAADGCVQQHLVDITGGDGLFVQHRSYIQPFRHRYIIEVLYFCDGLAYAETLCGKAGKDVSFAAVGYGYESVCILNAFFLEYVHVASVGIDDQCVGHFFTQDVAKITVFLDDLDIHLFRQFCSRFACDASAAEEDNIIDLAFRFAQLFAHELHALFGAHAINHVVLFHTVVATRDDGLLSAFDSYDAVFAVVVDAGREGLAYYLGSCPHLDHAKLQGTLSQMEVISHPVGPQALFNFVGCEHFRIDEMVETHVLKEFPVLGQQVFVVVNACQRALGA